MFTGQKVSTFQERFTQLVSESGKSLVQLSKELHISNQSLSTWRSGTRSPKEPTIIAVAEFFRVNVQWLMGFDVVKKANRQVIIGNSELFRKIIMAMTPEDYETVMRIFERTEIAMRERGEL
ncbi:MAG: helix-turn-helix transcriptional regulator [Treponema sp.]|nr:helix-turn-helix transcriptional regulator [Treponema sp.]